MEEGIRTRHVGANEVGTDGAGRQRDGQRRGLQQQECRGSVVIHGKSPRACRRAEAVVPPARPPGGGRPAAVRTACGCRSEEHTSELQSLMRISYAVFCLKKKKKTYNTTNNSSMSQQI